MRFGALRWSRFITCTHWNSVTQPSFLESFQCFGSDQRIFFFQPTSNNWICDVLFPFFFFFFVSRFSRLNLIIRHSICAQNVIVDCLVRRIYKREKYTKLLSPVSSFHSIFTALTSMTIICEKILSVFVNTNIRTIESSGKVVELEMTAGKTARFVPSKVLHIIWRKSINIFVLRDNLLGDENLPRMVSDVNNANRQVFAQHSIETKQKIENISLLIDIWR